MNMNIVTHIQGNLYDDLAKVALLEDNIILHDGNTEEKIHEYIHKYSTDAVYLLTDTSPYTAKAVTTIKNINKNIPVILICKYNKVFEMPAVDIIIPYTNILTTDVFCNIVYYNIKTYNKKLEKLLSLTSAIKSPISFKENWVFNPTNNTLFYNNEEILTLSKIHSGILEALLFNFGSPVKREIILEKVWNDTSYFTSRNLDVHLSNIRKIFKSNNINLNIKSIKGTGIIIQ